MQGSDAFTIYGAPIARDSLWVDAGLDFHLTSASTLGVSYQGQFGKGAQQNSVKARLNIGF